MLVDMHAHSNGISRCCSLSAAQTIPIAKENGIDGLVLTNHYQKDYASDGGYRELAKQYMKEIEYAGTLGEKIGVKIFWGIEVTSEPCLGSHLLIYGVDESFLLRHCKLFDYSLEKLYYTVKENEGVLIQAHPFRQNRYPLQDLRYLDGLEVSCHPKYESTYLERLTELAHEAGKILTCGGDYHGDVDYRPQCGVYLPEQVQDSRQLGAFLATTDSIRLCVHELNSTERHDVDFYRTKQ